MIRIPKINIITILLILTLTGCANLLNNNKSQTGTIVFASSSNTRAAERTSLEQLKNIRLIGIHNDKEVVLGSWDNYSQASNKEIKVEIGLWDFTLEATSFPIGLSGSLKNKRIGNGKNLLTFVMDIAPIKTTIPELGSLYNKLVNLNIPGTYKIEIDETISNLSQWDGVKTALNTEQGGVKVSLYANFNNLGSPEGTPSGSVPAPQAITEMTVLPETKIIGKHVFKGFTNLKKITLYGDLVDCGIQTFLDCNLSTIDYKGTMAQWCSLDHHYSRLHPPTVTVSSSNPDYTLIIDGKEINNEVTIPNGVTTLSSGVFKNCHKITKINLPDTIKTASVQTFAYCKNLSTVNIPTSLKEIPEKMFYACQAIQNINVPANITKFGTSAFGKCTGLTEITLNDGLKQMNGNVFEGCAALTSLTIPKTVNYIGNQFVKGCDSLNSVDFKEKTGWKAGSSPVDLSNPNNVATQLKSTYVNDALKNSNIK